MGFALRAAFAALSLVAPRAAAEACAIRGTHVTLDSIHVVTAKGPLSMRAIAVPITAVPSASPKTAVEVTASLFFQGDTNDPRYAVARSVAKVGGVLRAKTSASALHVRAKDDQISADLDLGDGVVANRVALDCEDLTLDAPSKKVPARGSANDGDGSVYMASLQVLTFHRDAGDGPSVRLTIEDPGKLALYGVRTASKWAVPWVLVRADLDGAEVRGWVARDAVKPRPLMGYGSTGGSGTFGCLRGTSIGSGTYRGPASIEVGAIVHFAPNEAPWALVQGSKGFLVRHDNGSDWVEITYAPGVSERGVCNGLAHAFVKRSSVSFPDGVIR